MEDKSARPQSESSPVKISSKVGRVINDVSQTIVLILSLLLIVYISYDTFENVPFLQNHIYMTFQFWVCIVFLLDFFIGFILSHNKKAYIKSRWFFFVISIPYLNLLNLMSWIELSPEVLYFIRFIPLVRGCYSLSIVVGYISRNHALSILTQYGVVLLTIVYISSLIFYYEEHNINSNVVTYWDALYWVCMYVTTVGCSYSAVTVVGKVISVILPVTGMLIIPLFTVWVINSVKQFNNDPNHPASGPDSQNANQE